MKKSILLVSIIVLIFSGNAFGYKKEGTTSKNQKKVDSIEIIDGIPKNRKFKKLTPIMGRCSMFLSLNCAMKQAKKQAHKAGADAIIEVQVNGSRSTSAGYAQGIAFFGSDEFPVVTGWAVKWLE